jgi:tRNA(adenine34) deaminase
MLLSPYNDEFFMNLAYLEAQKAFDLGEVPIGAVIVANKQVIAKAHNLTEQLADVTAHAEIQAITAAANNIGGKYLKGCTLYVTLEPCAMCAGALYWSQIDKIVYAVRDEKCGAGNLKSTIYHPKTLVTNGVMEEECRELLQAFFKTKRKSKSD